MRAIRPTTTRSFFAAVFITGKGFTPTVHTDEFGKLVYTFTPAARPALSDYYAVKDQLDTLTGGHPSVWR